METFLKSYDTEPWHITSLGLILTAFAILNLIKGDFYIFILLILTAQYTDNMKWKVDCIMNALPIG
jgi:phosphatidylserine synthase